MMFNPRLNKVNVEGAVASRDRGVQRTLLECTCAAAVR
jgi:hypothetical protein